MALALAILIWILTFVITYYFIRAKAYGWWFPELISQYGEIDVQFVRTLIVTGVAFVVSHIGLGYAVYKYRHERPGKADYSHGNTKLELIWAAIIAVIFIATAFIGQRVWINLHLTQPPPGAMQVEVLGQQFAWVFRYPGDDKKFGKTDPAKINDQDNPVGLVADDSDGKDDLISRGRIVVPENQPVELILRSKDVTHSFFVPSLRFKQDSVPGLSIKVHFTANKVGEYEVACAELCGLGHYKMRGVFEVKKKEDFDKWLKELKGE